MSGVDQMKIPGNTAKSVEERNIPWSQQVDEASYENLASPANDDNSANPSSMQFQYPPFHVKENLNTPWGNTNKGRKPSNNYDANKKYGKTGAYNNTKRDDYQINNWSSRRVIGENSGYLMRANRNDDGYSSAKLDNRSNEPAEENKTNAAPAAAPKKTTWASIASQPAKLTSRATLITSSHKKKGPGMPPPPMVPGKHNLDVNTWDLPNNNPPPIPSPPPPIDLSCADINSDFLVASSTEPPLGARFDKMHKSTDFANKGDDAKGPGSNSNFGRGLKGSPNGHTRKAWATPHSHPHQQSHMGHQGSVRPGSGPGPAPASHQYSSNSNSSRRGETGISQNRHNERRVNYSHSHGHSGIGGSMGGMGRSDSESSSKFEPRDENNPKAAENVPAADAAPVVDPQSLLEELKDKNNYNPTEIDLDKATAARFFVIKSYSEDDIHRSIKYEIWCSTDHGNKRLDDAFKERQKDGGNILLFFSVNGSGHFCGMAQMMTAVDYNSISSVWSQDKWKGKFKVKWIYVKDVPNGKLRHIRLENNDNKSVTNSRDTQEVPNSKGIEVLQILHSFKHSTSIFDDFSHYEKKQKEEVSSKRPPLHAPDNLGSIQAPPMNRHFQRPNDDRDRERGSTQKYFPGGGSGYRDRDRNSIHRSNAGGGGGGYHNSSYNNEYRRGFDGQRSQNSDRDRERDRENSEFDRDNEFSMRHGTKFENNRRGDDHVQSNRMNSREQKDYSTDQMKSDTRFRAGPGLAAAARDLPKNS